MTFRSRPATPNSSSPNRSPPPSDRYGRGLQDLVPGRFVAAVASFLV
ncbi:hypothetical protein [Streptomyces parvus]